jgi:hypothetical protein
VRIEMSISSHIAAIDPVRRKDYLWTMNSHGLEMGVGRSGQYAAHAHRNMVDVMFAPEGIRCGDPGSAGYVSGTLLIALPGTWFGPVVTGDFFFIKFYCDQRRTGVPDKIVDRRYLDKDVNMPVKGVMVGQGTAAALLPIFRPGYSDGADSSTEISLTTDSLSCRFGESDTLLVAR